MANELLTPPPMYWAQRKNCVYLRVAVEDCKDPIIKLEKDSLYFRGIGGTEKKPHEVKLQLFAEIKPEESKYSVRGRGTEFVLIKANDKAPYWKRLVSDNQKHHWIKVDFNKWKDEDDSDEEGTSNQGDFEEMMRQMGGLGGGGNPSFDDIDQNEKDSDDEELPDLED